MAATRSTGGRSAANRSGGDAALEDASSDHRASSDSDDASDAGSTSESLVVYVGSGFYTSPNAIVAFALNATTGALTEIQRLASDPSPSFFALHPSGKVLYANLEATPTAAAAYAVDRSKGKLTKINQVASGANGSAFLSVDMTGRWLFQANYESQSVSIIAIKPDGSLGALSDTRAQGAMAYPHCVHVDPTNQFVFVPNRSADTISQYIFDVASGRLTPHFPSSVSSPSGTGPRHIAFHPNLKWVFVVDETASSLTSYAFDSRAGTLTRRKSISSLPANAGASAPADIRLHPNGNFLYVANRGHASVGTFAVDATSGTLSPIDFPSSGGKGPRNFALDPSGRFLVVGNLDSDNVQVFRVDPFTGKLMPVGTPVSVPKPSGILVTNLR